MEHDERNQRKREVSRDIKTNSNEIRREHHTRHEHKKEETCTDSTDNIKMGDVRKGKEKKELQEQKQKKERKAEKKREYGRRGGETR